MRAGEGSPWHVHPDEDEWFYVLAGEFTVYVGDERLSLPAGSFAFGPKGVPHTFIAETDGAKALIGFQPFLFEGFLHEVGEPATERVLPPPLEAPPRRGSTSSPSARETGSRSSVLQARPRPLTPNALVANAYSATSRRSSTGDHGAHTRLLSETEGVGRGDRRGRRFHGFPDGAARLPASAPGKLSASLPLQQRLRPVEQRGLARRRGRTSITVEFGDEAGDRSRTRRARSRRRSATVPQGRRHDARLATSSSPTVNGMAAELVSSQFAKAIGIAIDDGDHRRLGHRRADGDPQHGRGHLDAGRRAGGARLLMDSVLKAAGRLAEDFITPDTLVVHPRDFVKFGLATDLTGRYLFDRRSRAGSSRASGITVVADANMAADLGVGLERDGDDPGRTSRPAPSSSAGHRLSSRRRATRAGSPTRPSSAVSSGSASRSCARPHSRC